MGFWETPRGGAKNEKEGKVPPLRQVQTLNGKVPKGESARKGFHWKNVKYEMFGLC